MKARTDTSQEQMGNKIKTGLEEMKAMESEAIVAHPEDSNEATCEKTIRATENRFRDRHLAVRCHGWPKKRNQGDAGSWQRLATVHGQLTRHAVPALHKGCGDRRPDKTPGNSIRG
jgi:hypothetical protein